MTNVNGITSANSASILNNEGKNVIARTHTKIGNIFVSKDVLKSTEIKDGGKYVLTLNDGTRVSYTNDDTADVKNPAVIFGAPNNTYAFNGFNKEAGVSNVKIDDSEVANEYLINDSSNLNIKLTDGADKLTMFNTTDSTVKTKPNTQKFIGYSMDCINTKILGNLD